MTGPAAGGGGRVTIARGIAFLIAATACLATMDAISKLLTEGIPPVQILATKLWIFAAFAAVYVSRRGGGGVRRHLRSAAPRLQIARSLLLGVEMTAFVIAFSLMPLADVHAIASAAPLVTMLLAVAFLGERIGPRRAMAALVGFAGVLVIIRPGGAVFQAESLIPLGGAVLWGGYQVLLRRVSAVDPPETTLLYTAFVTSAAFTLVAPFVWVWPSPTQWGLLVIVGMLGSAAHTLLIRAYDAAPAARLQPFAYSLLVWAVIMGFLFFGHLPDVWTITGAAIVVGSGLYAWWREREAPDSAAAPRIGR